MKLQQGLLLGRRRKYFNAALYCFGVSLSAPCFSDIHLGLDLSSTAQYQPEPGVSTLFAAIPSINLSYQGRSTELNSQASVKAESVDLKATEEPTWYFDGSVKQQLIVPLLSLTGGYQHLATLSENNEEQTGQDKYRLGLVFQTQPNLASSFQLETRYQQSHSDLPAGKVKGESALASVQYSKQLRTSRRLIALAQYQDYLNDTYSLTANLSLIAFHKKGVLTTMIGLNQANTKSDKSDTWLGSISLLQKIPDRATLNYVVSHQRTDGDLLLNEIPGFNSYSANQLFDTTNASISIAIPSLNNRLNSNLSYQYSWLESVFASENTKLASKQEFDLASLTLVYAFSKQTQLSLNARYSFIEEQANSKTNLDFKRQLNRHLSFSTGLSTVNEDEWFERAYVTLRYSVGGVQL